MKPKNFFLKPASPSQRRYEALRLFYAEGISSQEAARKMDFSPAYFKKLRVEFARALKDGSNPFFPEKKTGPKKRFTDVAVIEKIIALRKQNHSIGDIKAVLAAGGVSLSLDAIDKILKAEGFAPLPKRTRLERMAAALPAKIAAPQSAALEIVDERFTTERNAGPLVFLPLIESLGIVPAIRAAGFPKTSQLDDVSSVLSLLALKLLGNERLSHDTSWNMDRALGLFAGLNVLPKSSTLSSYSYRVSRASNRKLLAALSRIFKDTEAEAGDFNLDFKAIPHWGDASVLEKNWCGARSKAMKSILSMIVQDPATGYVSYTDAQVRHRNQNDAVIEFVDFWKDGRGAAPKMLIFDSRFTSYAHLSRLNGDGIKFLTIRRRGKQLVGQVAAIPDEQWLKVKVEGEKRRQQALRVHDSPCKLRHYEGEVRQLILTGNGRQQPTFMITNDFDMPARDLVKKYARRWLVEQEIAEQIAFFHLNQPSSSIVVKVDFDLTLSLLAHNLYRVLTGKLPGFERSNVQTVYRNFLENGAAVRIENNSIEVQLRKKTHLPLLFEAPWMNQETRLSWLGVTIKFSPATTS